MDVVYGIKYTLFYQLHNGKVCSVSRPLDGYMKGLHWNFVWVASLTAFFFWRIEFLWR